MSPSVVRNVVSVLNWARLIALTPGWYDVATNTSLMDTAKARSELGWAPTRSSTESAMELLDGLAEGAIGASATTGWKGKPHRSFRPMARRVHDASPVIWSGAARSRALGIRRGGVPDVLVIAANLAAGTPMARDRVLERRQDPVALLAPAAVVSSLRGGWVPVAATAALLVLNSLERTRAR